MLYPVLRKGLFLVDRFLIVAYTFPSGFLAILFLQYHRFVREVRRPEQRAPGCGPWARGKITFVYLLLFHELLGGSAGSLRSDSQTHSIPGVLYIITSRSLPPLLIPLKLRRPALSLRISPYGNPFLQLYTSARCQTLRRGPGLVISQ